MWKMVCVLSVWLCLCSIGWGTLRSDLNGDCRVDFLDLAILASEWMLESEDCMADKYLQFDGSTGYITVPDDASLNFGTGDFSISFWAKDIFGSICTIVTKRQSITFTGFTVGYATTTNLVNLTLLEVLVGNTVVIPLSVIEGTTGWQHIAFSCDRDGNGVPYLNGVAQSAIDISAHGYTISTSESMLIGYNGTTNFVSGSIDDMRFYKGIVLSPYQINTIFAGRKGKKYSSGDAGNGLAFNFDEGIGNPMSDGVAGLTGVITGGVTWQSGGVPFAVSTGISIDIFESLFEEE